MREKTKSDILPIGPLMVEHRLIERVVALLEKELSNIRKTKRIDIAFLNSAIDFYRFYADRGHHGKEEDILFSELKKKPLSAVHNAMIDDLKHDHIIGRELVFKLDKDVNASCSQCNSGIINAISQDLESLIALYREHISKEDKQFFIPSMKYFAKEEQNAMLCRFWEFDRMLIHEKYKGLVELLENNFAAHA